MILNSENTSPFCEIATVAFVFFTSLAETVQTLGGTFVVTPGQWLNTFINLKIPFFELRFSDLRTNLRLGTRGLSKAGRFATEAMIFYLDTTDDSSFFEIVCDEFSIIIFLVESLVEENATTESFSDMSWSFKK